MAGTATTARRRTPRRSRTAGARLLPPPDGATVRMYRIGHGDCFLLAFPGAAADRPVYVLIDCGYKPGSSQFIDTTIKDITKNILQATGGHIDVAIITHEHQDHVNGITATNFRGCTIGETWLAWTEDPNDDLANELRERFHDQLLGLIAARNRLAAAGDADRAAWLDDFLAFELGGDDQVFDPVAAAALLGAAGDPANSRNKQSMKLFKDLAAEGVRYIRPHEAILTLPGTADVRVFALGPPRDPGLLSSLDPQGAEEFRSTHLAVASAGNFLAAAAAGNSTAPFASRYRVPWAQAFGDLEHGAFFTACYGQDAAPPLPTAASDEAPGNPDWRRIDRDWLYAAEQLALDMNDQTNNASLVLAFELGKSRKVLLFAADAQRGNWVSWAGSDWKDGDEVVTARDLLTRTVLYKVGHHGSHNATLNGTEADQHPNLAWMAAGEHAREFTAMITAVRAWAETQKGWDHPLQAIKDALLKKASGRVFQTDTDVAQMTTFGEGSTVDWQAFQSRTHGDRLYFDYTVTA